MVRADGVGAGAANKHVVPRVSVRLAATGQHRCRHQPVLSLLTARSFRTLH
ncbi:unnamed protein product [Brugia pahangi]|uniref:Uncharacterized protein n=1 Tax=Brugia pahangi TaxID=6280 RepID=A0A0N4TMU5_BRUPA|nr:unnamed protein product [Brugia pahangi]